MKYYLIKISIKEKVSLELYNIRNFKINYYTHIILFRSSFLLIFFKFTGKE